MSIYLYQAEKQAQHFRALADELAEAGAELIAALNTLNEYTLARLFGNSTAPDISIADRAGAAMDRLNAALAKYHAASIQTEESKP